MSGMSSFNLNSALSKAREAADMAREVASSAAATAATKAAEISKVAKARGSDLIDRLNYRPESVIISGQPITLVKVLAEGGYGYVYIAKHQDDGRTYAVKRMLTQTSEAADMAKTEIDIMNQLPKHQNIVRLLPHRRHRHRHPRPPCRLRPHRLQDGACLPILCPLPRLQLFESSRLRALLFVQRPRHQ